MAQFLKQSTATTVTVGPFVDNSDGVTPETGLAAGTVDEIGVYKHEATSLTDISGDTTFTHRAGGMYTVTLDTGDTNTVGRLRLFIRDDSVCLPVWKDFMVLPANVFDSQLGTDNLDVNVAEVSDDSTAADNLELITEITNITSLAIDASGHVEADVVEISGDSTAANNAELAFDGTGYGFTGCTMPTTTDVTNRVTANTDQIEGVDATDQINAACDTAIETYHLDHLLAVDYDPASKPGVATALLNELVESDTGVSRFTANALEAITNDDTQIDASALNTLSGHDPGGTIAAQTDVTGLNNLSAADVNAEVDTAIETYHLDHLLAANYDPASKPGVATALLNELIENDGGVSRFTANAIEAITNDDTQIDGSALNALTGVSNISSLTIDATGHVEADVVEVNGSANIESTYNLQEVLRIMLAVLAGESTGGGTTSVAFRDVADAKDRVAATVDADGNRTAITLDAS